VKIVPKRRRLDRATVWRVPSGGWYWTLRCPYNGKIIGASSEGYRRRRDCVANLERVTGGRHAPVTGVLLR
jgi:uncharacterized protein YegP (UPF0339 family)